MLGLETGVSITRFQINAATGAVEQRRCVLQLFDKRLQIRGDAVVGIDVSASNLVDARLGAAPTDTELSSPGSDAPATSHTPVALLQLRSA